MSTKFSDFPIVTDPTIATDSVVGVRQSGSVFTNFRTSIQNLLKKIQPATSDQLGGVKVGGSSAGDVLSVSLDGKLSVSITESSGLSNVGTLSINRPVMNGYNELYAELYCDDFDPTFRVLYNSGFLSETFTITREISGVYKVSLNNTLDEFPLDNLIVFPSVMDASPDFSVTFSNFYGSPPAPPYITKDFVFRVYKSGVALDDTLTNLTVRLHIIVLR